MYYLYLMMGTRTRFSIYGVSQKVAIQDYSWLIGTFPLAPDIDTVPAGNLGSDLPLGFIICIHTYYTEFKGSSGPLMVCHGPNGKSSIFGPSSLFAEFM